MMAIGELRRLRMEPDPDEKLNGFTESFVVSCPGNAEVVLSKAKEVMEIVLRYRTEDWPSDAEWPSLLPALFVAACAPEMSHEQDERDLEAWKKLSHEERVQTARTERWSPSNGCSGCIRTSAVGGGGTRASAAQTNCW